MNKKLNLILLVFLVVIFIVGVIFFFNKTKTSHTNNLDNFAQCLKKSGAEFYGAFWCPHCQNQKKEFGSSEKYLPYIECSTTNGQNQLQICKDKKIEGYPTWIFSDGSRLSGELPLKTLSEKTQCQLP